MDLPSVLAITDGNMNFIYIFLAALAIIALLMFILGRR